MDLSLIEALLETQRVAYVLADQQLVIVAAGGPEYIGQQAFPLVPGEALLAVVPELAGSEALIGEVLAGSLPELVLEHISRPRVDGASAFFMLRLRAIGRGAGPAQLLAQISDTTELSRLQLLAQDELRRVDEMKSNFVAVAAHELRNPLTPILGYLELLLDEESGPLNADQRTTLEVVLKNVLRLRTITSDLLDLARIEAGRVELVLRPTDLHTLVSMVCLEYQPQITARQQQLELVAGTVPAALCDETRAVQIIGNLLSNACKYTPAHGRIRVRIGPGDEGFVLVAIEDTGIGIGADDQPYLFDAFFRARSAAAQGTGGTGLGLHITRLLAELHGGRIWFTSAAGQGSTFYVTFAISDEPPYEPGAASAERNHSEH